MIWMLCILTFFLSSCDQKPQETQYKEVVVQSPQPSAPVAQAMPTDQAASPAVDPHAGMDMSAMGLPSGMNSAMSHMFSWSAPQGWTEEPGTGMRLVTFHRSSDAKAIDCSLVALGGMAGGLEANLRRWMGQIGVKATDDELSALIASAPNTSIKSGQGGKTFDFTSIQTKSELNAKSMIVVMVIMDEATLFIKMSGTLDTVNKNKDDFFKLVSSVEYHAPAADTTMPASATPAMDANTNPAGDPHAGLDMSAMGGVIEASTAQNILAWMTPDSWKEEPGKHMRMASFHLINDPNAIDCYIIALSGPAGGIEANLQRWLGQLNLQPSDENVNQLIISAEGLKTKDGLDVKVFDLSSLQPQAGPTDKTMLAAMIGLEKTTVFVKMTGSIESVKANKDNFLKLLGSISKK